VINYLKSVIHVRLKKSIYIYTYIFDKSLLARFICGLLIPYLSAYLQHQWNNSVKLSSERSSYKLCTVAWMISCLKTVSNSHEFVLSVSDKFCVLLRISSSICIVRKNSKLSMFARRILALNPSIV